ncbi:MAG: UDP-N-acetylmuramoyl-tripeptide--D-alanyl-D-alanine ligase, partial [Actinobacteria bacterium]|nr:UDP-N-acetylmuramoyl-tripeptide--D-alanyl-D-alanine ligase [Actinomycetota bacterium]
LTRAGGADAVTGVSIASRRGAMGDLCVAVGRGIAYTTEALERGAAAALVPDDAVAALAALGAAVRDRTDARVVAITGATAKTSTKDILGALCGAVAPTVVAEGSQNNEIGLPLTLCRIEPETEVVVLEMGMRGLGQIAALCRIARPHVGVITKIGPVHLELVGTVERVAQAKAEVIDALPRGGVAIVPAGEPLLEPYLDRDGVRVVRFGPGGAVALRSFEPVTPGGRLVADVEGETVELEVPFTARHHAENTVAALAAYAAVGLPLAAAARGAAAIRFSKWRGEEVRVGDEIVLVNDSYNANPLSMAAALHDLSERAGGARKIAVLGDMAELGDEGPRFHREIGDAAARAGVAVLIAVGELARGYVEGAAEVEEVRWAPTVQAAVPILRELLRPGDYVLVKGSRAVGLEAVADALAVIAA